MLLVAEILLVSQFADSGAVSGREWWAVLLRKAPNLAQAALVGGSFCLVLGGVILRRQWRSYAVSQGQAPPFSPLCLAVHLAAFIVWMGASLSVFHSRIHQSSAPEIWVAGWGITVLFTVATWSLTAVPRPLWRLFFPKVLPVAVLAAPLGLLAWGLGRISRELWHPMTDLTLSCVSMMLEACGQTCVVVPEEALIGTQTFQVGILDGCSGYQGIGLTSAFLAGYCLLQHRYLRFPQVLVLIPAAALVSWFANLVRIAVLILVGTYFSRDVALGGFHSHAGWIAFCGIGIGTVLISQRVRWFRREPPTVVEQAPIVERAACGRGRSSLPVAFLLPFLLSIATAMLVGLVTVNSNFTAAAQMIAGGGVLLWFRDSYGEPLLRRWSWTAVGVGAGVCLFWIAASGLTPGVGSDSSEPAWMHLPTGWRLAGGLFWLGNACLIVPIVEELAFRGYLLRRLQSIHFEAVRPDQFTWKGLVVSSVLFGLLHPSHLLGGVVAGMAYAFVLAHRGRISDAIVAHATTNALLAAYVWSTGDWQAWG